MTRGMKQIAVVATLQLRGMAVLVEVTDDYLVYQSSSLHTVRQAIAIANELTENYGILVVVR